MVAMALPFGYTSPGTCSNTSWGETSCRPHLGGRQAGTLGFVKLSCDVLPYILVAPVLSPPLKGYVVTPGSKSLRPNHQPAEHRLTSVLRFAIPAANRGLKRSGDVMHGQKRGGNLGAV